MAHAISHAPAYPRPVGRTNVLSSQELSWGIVLLLAWLGWPIARDFLAWVLLKAYDLYITYVH
ncbi:hypothetical protein [Chitinophaga caseinilytica]|uniref:Fatty acid desaturase n=1 Tax=Chitinophaga caseinilytica TaxID=2267521 RepID=A0ABZ2YWF7_9BACT